MNEKIERISSNLQGTTQNLRSLDHMLVAYKDAGREQKSAIDKLRSDLSTTSDNLKEERRRSAQLSASRGLHASDLDLSADHEQTGLKSALRGYDSDVESPTSRRRKRRSGCVRFADDMNRDLHSLHQHVRDVSFSQDKLEDSFSHDQLKRDLNDGELRRSVRDVADKLLPRKGLIESSVERRLQAIQNDIKAERSLMDRRYDEVGEISTDLKQALQYHQHLAHQPPPQPTPVATVALDDIRFHKNFLETEALKHKVEHELDHIKRQLDHSEGGKVALTNQIEELKTRLAKADQDKQRMKSQLDDSRADDTSRDRRKKRELEEERERDHKRFENEIQDLRGQLTKSMSAVSLSEDLRREVERGERQRTQLSDHIEVLVKDLENKDKHLAKAVAQLKEASDRRDESERQKQQMFVQLEDSLTRLKDVTSENDRVTGELNMTQQNLEMSDRKREEFKGRAQETVKQWKAKCKQLQQDGEHYKQGYSEVMRRNEQLGTDLGLSHEQVTGVSIAVEKIRTELSDSMGMRAKLEEMNHQKDKEINDLLSIKIEVESEIRDAKINNDRLHHDLEKAAARLSATAKERYELDEQVNRLKAAQIVIQDHNTQLQRDVKELRHTNMEMGAQLTEARNHIEEQKHNLCGSSAREKSMDEELNKMKAQMKEEHAAHKSQVEQLTDEIAVVKGHHHREIQELGQQVKREMADYDAEIDLLRIELEKERTNVKRTRQTDEKLHKEMERLHDEIQKYEDNKMQSSRKMEKLQLECESQTQKSLEDLQTLKVTEDELFHSKEQLRNVEVESTKIVERISSDVDEAIDVIAEGSKTKYQELGSLPPDVPYHMNVVSSIRNRLQWVKREIRDQRKAEKKLRRDLLDTTNVSEKDRKYLMSEIVKKEEKLDELIVIKDELLQRDDKNVDAVVMLHEKLKDISDELQIQKLREEDRVKELISVEKKETEIQTTNIEDRYVRLKDTMRQLQEDLRDAKLSSYQDQGLGDGCLPTDKPTNTSHTPTRDRLREKSPSRNKNRKTSPTRRILYDSPKKK